VQTSNGREGEVATDVSLSFELRVGCANRLKNKLPMKCTVESSFGWIMISIAS